jgi:ferredoxin
MYGVIPSGLRLEYHRRFPRNDVFSQMLVDLFTAVPPSLNMMDAVVGMEGEGPSSGIPKRLGLVISGRDGVAVDAVASRIVGTDPLQVFTTSFAAARGLGVGDLERIEILGERVRNVEARDFRPSLVATGSSIYAYVSGRLILTPEVIPEKCQACLECINICPVRTIRQVKGKAWISKSECIHCLCCHEVCAYRAIRLRQRTVGRLFRGAERLFKKVRTLFRKASLFVFL